MRNTGSGHNLQNDRQLATPQPLSNKPPEPQSLNGGSGYGNLKNAIRLKFLKIPNVVPETLRNERSGYKLQKSRQPVKKPSVNPEPRLLNDDLDLVDALPQEETNDEDTEVLWHETDLDSGSLDEQDTDDDTIPEVFIFIYLFIFI